MGGALYRLHNIKPESAEELHVCIKGIRSLGYPLRWVLYTCMHRFAL